MASLSAYIAIIIMHEVALDKQLTYKHVIKGTYFAGDESIIAYQKQ